MQLKIVNQSHDSPKTPLWINKLKKVLVWLFNVFNGCASPVVCLALAAPTVTAGFGAIVMVSRRRGRVRNVIDFIKKQTLSMVQRTQELSFFYKVTGQTKGYQQVIKKKTRQTKAAGFGLIVMVSRRRRVQNMW